MKKIIYFPSSYKKALQNKTKKCTIRTDNEVDKYKEGQIYTDGSTTKRQSGADIFFLSCRHLHLAGVPLKLNKDKLR